MQAMSLDHRHASSQMVEIMDKFHEAQTQVLAYISLYLKTMCKVENEVLDLLTLHVCGGDFCVAQT